MMNKQRFAIIGCVGFILFLALVSLQATGKSANSSGSGSQPQPVVAPAATSASAKSTPAPVHEMTQPVQPIPQPVPIPPGMSEESVPPSAPTLLPTLLLGLLVSGTVVLILGFAIGLSPRRNNNGRFIYRSLPAEGVHA